MTLIKGENGGYRGLFRRKGMRPLHVSLKTTKRSMAKDHHDAVQRVVREGRFELIEQLRTGVVTVERLAAMVSNREALHPVAAPDRVSKWDTVDDAADRYLEWMRVHPNRTKRTTELAGFQIARFRNFLYEGERVGARPLDRVTSAVVIAYQTSMLDAKNPANTITTYMARVGALWTWAIDAEQREAREQRRASRELYSPVVADMLFRELHPRDRMLSIGECNRLIAATPAPLLWFVGCGLLAGLRMGETLHLRPGIDVDVDVGTITVREQAAWGPKTDRSKRLVPMAPELHEIAKVHASRYANDVWMLPSPVDASLPMGDLMARRHFEPIVERAGMVYGRDHKQGVTYHTLRHSFASHAVMRGVDLYTVSKLLGDSLKTVEGSYADLSPDFKRAAVTKLSGAFALGNLPEVLQPELQEIAK